MRNVKIAVALAALALTGCTGGGPAGGPSSTTSTPPPTSLPTTSSPATTPGTTSAGGTPPPQSSAPPLPGAASQVPVERVDASTLSDAYRREAWVSADGRTLQVFSLAGGCKRASAEVVAQGADQVQVALVTTYYPPNDGVCTEELYSVPVDVVLTAPLGERRVVLEAREQTG
ncbi:hypothetical protein ABZ816_36075 [Actinosynnema sp. NPDC047251]|uniref:Putative secreted protein n=1 Tax=Saccharothrix espanaensis (strain ATCC 51144 / DSM 44229 / JCM 9112 / NBRC 15066 / NRRL 15764) TaxID=1179773 RepID=K0JPS3_SACES|nr:hypothetical protein [Saccharothrix espanaensis]CCH29095.1 putative secreted protein [Saccharothrix espanaensis DSM 44229]